MFHNWTLLLGTPFALYWGIHPYLQRRLRIYEYVIFTSWLYFAVIFTFYNLIAIGYLSYPLDELKMVWKWSPAIPAILWTFVRRVDHTPVEYDILPASVDLAEKCMGRLRGTINNSSTTWHELEIRIANDDWRLPSTSRCFAMTRVLSDGTTLVIAIHASVRYFEPEDVDTEIVPSVNLNLSVKHRGLEGFIILESIDEELPTDLLLMEKWYQLFSDSEPNEITVTERVAILGEARVPLDEMHKTFTQIPWKKVASEIAKSEDR